MFKFPVQSDAVGGVTWRARHVFSGTAFSSVFQSSVSFENWKDNTGSILQKAKLRCEEAVLINYRCQISFSGPHTNLHELLLRVVRSDGCHLSTCRSWTAPRGSLFSCAFIVLYFIVSDSGCISKVMIQLRLKRKWKFECIADMEEIFLPSCGSGFSRICSLVVE